MKYIIIIVTLLILSCSTNNNLEKGYNALNDGQYKLAISFFSKIIDQEDSVQADVYYKIGLAYSKLGNNEKGLFYFSIADTIGFIDIDFYMNYGDLLFKSENYEKALEYFKKAQNIDPDYPYLNFNLGITYEVLSDVVDPDLYDLYTKNSLFYLYRELFFDSENHNALFYVGYILNKIGNYEMALEKINQGLAIYPNDPHAFYIKGTILFNLDKYDKAIESHSMAIELNPYDAEYFLKRSAAFIGLDYFKEAFHDIENCLSLEPDNEDCIYMRLHANYLRGSYADACDDYNKLKSMNYPETMRINCVLFTIRREQVIQEQVIRGQRCRRNLVCIASICMIAVETG